LKHPVMIAASAQVLLNCLFQRQLYCSFVLKKAEKKKQLKKRQRSTQCRVVRCAYINPRNAFS